MRRGKRVRCVDQHFADVFGEIIAQRARDRIAFAKDQAGRCQGQHRFDDLVPLHFEVVEIPLQLGGGATDASRAHDGAHTVGDDQIIHDLLHLIALFAFNTARYAAGARVVRHQHQEAPRKADESGERGAFVAALFLFHLHDDVLAFTKDVAHVGARALGLPVEPVARDFLQRQEAVALSAIVYEARFERGLDARNFTFVDVRFFLFAGREFYRKVIELLAVDQRNTQLFLLGCID